jgi:hypothetical protein
MRSSWTDHGLDAYNSLTLLSYLYVIMIIIMIIIIIIIIRIKMVNST